MTPPNRHRECPPGQLRFFAYPETAAPCDLVPSVPESDCWTTPQWVADLVGEFALDPASNPRSVIRARRSYQLERGEDGLRLAWKGSVWLNPPYSDPAPWCDRLAEHDAAWCALVKLDPSTRWWATLMRAGASWAPFRARLRFGLPGRRDAAPPFCSALIWRGWSMPAALEPHLWRQP